jgi:hypothetical protein
MNDHSKDRSHAAPIDHILRRLVTSIESPQPAPHAPPARRTEIHAAIRSAWPSGQPPTVDDLARNPHPVDWWDNWTPRSSSGGSDTADPRWPWTFGDPGWGNEGDRPGHRGPA